MIPNYRPPLIIKKLFKDFIWQTSNDKILITFDDGPSEIATEKILNILANNGIRAMFFCVGENVRKYPELVKRLIEDGHLIANHTMKHQLINKLTIDEVIDDIKSFNDLLNDFFNYNVKYFRPPHGKFDLRTNTILKKQGMQCVMWSLLSKDYENNLEIVKYGMDKKLNSNSIIVFHDNLKSGSIIEDSIKYTIEVASKKGFKFGEPENCLK